MPPAKNMPSKYYTIYNNLRNKFDKTGYVGRQKYIKWEGEADRKAHQIALSYIKSSNKKLIDDLDYFYKKTRDIEMNKSFNHPDYIHVHGKEYDPDN